MYLVESKGGAIVCMMLSLFFLGTWPALMTLLERRGRLPQHTYLDYSITNLLVAVVMALTFGQIGATKPDMPNFITQLSQDNWPCILFALAGGIFLSIGNLSKQYSWAFIGVPVTEVIASSITVVIGTTLNYFLDDRINKAQILFPGVGCFLIAVFMGSAVHFSNSSDNKAKLHKILESNNDGTGTKKEIKGTALNKGDLENESIRIEKPKAGTADFLIEVENQRSIKVGFSTTLAIVAFSDACLYFGHSYKVFGKNILISYGIIFFAGVCLSLFSPAFNLATNDQWHTMKEGVPHLVVYTAFFYFSISCFIIGVGLNICFLYHPILNLPRTTFKAYLNDWDGRPWAFLAGILCGFGNGLQFMGGQAAGYAAADSVQALPLVSTFWGILLFGEYQRSSKRTYKLLVSMLVMFVVSVALLMASSGQRKT